LLGTRITRVGGASAPLLGKQFQRSPALTLSLGADWRPVDPLRLSAQLRHNAGYYSDDLELPGQHVGGATVTDARASWTVGRFNLFGYVRNLGDAFYFTWRFAPAPGRPLFATLGDPREAGIGLEARF
jgi:outer membrane receptor protein involved in Fe transport